MNTKTRFPARWFSISYSNSSINMVKGPIWQEIHRLGYVTPTVSRYEYLWLFLWGQLKSRPYNPLQNTLDDLKQISREKLKGFLKKFKSNFLSISIKFKYIWHCPQETFYDTFRLFLNVPRLYKIWSKRRTKKYIIKRSLKSGRLKFLWDTLKF